MRWRRSFTRLSRYNRRFRHANVRIRASVVEQITLPLPDHAFYKNNVWDLADFFPFSFGSEDGRIGAREQDSWVVPIKERHSRTVYEFVIGAVVDENNSFRRNDRCRPRLGNARVKLAGPHRQYRHISGFGPVQEICGRG